MTTLYSLTWTPGPGLEGEGYSFFSSETKARKSGPEVAKEQNVTVVLEKWSLPDKRDISWLCRLMSTHDPETRERVTSGIAEGPAEELARFSP